MDRERIYKWDHLHLSQSPGRGQRGHCTYFFTHVYLKTCVSRWHGCLCIYIFTCVGVHMNLEAWAGCQMSCLFLAESITHHSFFSLSSGDFTPPVFQECSSTPALIFVGSWNRTPLLTLLLVIPSQWGHLPGVTPVPFNNSVLTTGYPNSKMAS